MKFLGKFIALLMLLYSSSCSDYNEKESVDFIYKTSSLDSAFRVVEDYPFLATINAFSYRVKQECQVNPDTVENDKWIQRLYDFGDSLNREDIRNVAYRSRVIQQFVVGNMGSARRWARIALNSAATDESVDILDVYHLMGLSYYSGDNKSDSTLKYWKLGYQTAVELNDEYRISFFATNLGTLFFELDLMSISREFFLKALSQGKLINSVTPMLVNNIITTLINDKDISSAVQYMNDYRDLLNVKPNTYENQTIYLNQIVLNQKMGNFELCDSFLHVIKFPNIHESLKAKLVSLNIRQYVETGNAFYIRSSVKENLAVVGLDFLDNMPREFNKLNKPELDFLWITLESEVSNYLKNLDKIKIHDNLKDALAMLSEKYEKTNRAKSSHYAIEFRNVVRNESINKHEILNYMDEVQKVDDLFDAILKRNYEIESQHQKNRSLWIILLVIAILLAVSLMYFRSRIRFRQQEQEILLKEKDILVRENIIKNRTVEFSKELLEFNKKIKNDLDRMNFSSDNTEYFKKFRSELLGYITVNLEQNPVAVDHTIDELEEKKESSNWDTLNKTEKRVFALLKEGFKANEIGRMLGVTTQYVYNLKAKLKRLGLEVN